MANNLGLNDICFYKDDLLKLNFGAEIWMEFFEDPKSILSESGDFVTLSAKFYPTLLKVSKNDKQKCSTFLKELDDALTRASRYNIISHQDDPDLERWLNLTDKIISSGKLKKLEAISSQVLCPHDRTVGKYKFSLDDLRKMQTKLWGSNIYGRMISDSELLYEDQMQYRTQNKSLFRKSESPGKKRFIEDVFYFGQEAFGLESEGLSKLVEIISKSALVRKNIGNGYDSQPLISKIKKEYEEVQKLGDMAFYLPGLGDN